MQIGKAKFVLLNLIALIGLGCTPKVSESEARKLVEGYRRSENMQIVSLHKTDGLAEVENGANYYTMEYKLEVVYPKGYESPGTSFKAGEVYKETGRIHCVRTENGWKVLDLRVWHVEK